MAHVLVIGSGPSGLSAALTLQQAGVSVTVATTHHSSLQSANLTGDLYGVSAKDGEALYRQGVEQARQVGITMVDGEITGLTKSAHTFTAAGQQPIDASAVILATGKPHRYDLPNFAKHSHRLHLRAEEHAFVYRHQMVGVVGHGSYAFAQVNLLTRHARTVTLFTNGDDLLRFPPNLSINRYPIRLFDAPDSPRTLLFENGAKLNVDALFFADRTADAADLCAGVGISCENGIPPCTAQGETPQKGLFVAGECAGLPFDLHELLYHGYKVGLATLQFLKNNTI